MIPVAIVILLLTAFVAIDSDTGDGASGSGRPGSET
jgi:hypothetical protein